MNIFLLCSYLDPTGNPFPRIVLQNLIFSAPLSSESSFSVFSFTRSFLSVNASHLCEVCSNSFFVSVRRSCQQLPDELYVLAWPCTDGHCYTIYYTGSGKADPGYPATAPYLCFYSHFVCVSYFACTSVENHKDEMSKFAQFKRTKSYKLLKTIGRSVDFAPRQFISKHFEETKLSKSWTIT